MPGFPERAEALDRYEERSGNAVRDLDWHEVFALVRALAINDRHQRVSGDPRHRDNPMGAVLLGADGLGPLRLSRRPAPDARQVGPDRAARSP